MCVYVERVCIFTKMSFKVYFLWVIDKNSLKNTNMEKIYKKVLFLVQWQKKKKGNSIQ